MYTIMGPSVGYHTQRLALIILRNYKKKLHAQLLLVCTPGR